MVEYGFSRASARKWQLVLLAVVAQLRMDGNGEVAPGGVGDGTLAC